MFSTKQMESFVNRFGIDPVFSVKGIILAHFFINTPYMIRILGQPLRILILGTLKYIVEMPLVTNFDTAVYIATLNAVCKYLEITDKTVHCKDGEPESCNLELVEYINKKYGNPKIALIGYQPAMLERLSKNCTVRIVDLDSNNIGKVKYNVIVEDGNESVEDLLNWCDIVVATGSTIANKTITNFMLEKPTVFFGTTLAGAASLMNLERFCYCSS